MAQSISDDISSLIQYFRSLPSFNSISKHNFDSLTPSERCAFLKWGGFSIGPRLKSGRQTILDENEQPFSKKGLNRVIRRYFESQKRPERRKLARKRKRENKALNQSQKLNTPRNSKYRTVRGKNLRKHVESKLKDHPNSPHIVLDCRFDHLMTHQQVVSVSNQFRQLYGVNMKASIPCHLYATSFGGRLRNHFKHKNEGDPGGLGGDALLNVWCMDFIEESMESHFAAQIESEEKEFVYLTADSEHELEQMEKDKIYVIGAFVDKNKYKGYSYKMAVENGWKTARLPIMKYMTVNPNDHSAQRTRLVITINQVFAILVAYYNWKDWRKALQFAFPSRKGLVLKQRMSPQEIEQLVFDGHRIPIL